MTDCFVGSRTRRTEDPALLTGRGLYVDDVHLPGMLHAAFVRSPHAHARIRSIDAARARTLAGVQAVYTWADLPRAAQERIPLLTPNPAIRDPLTQYPLAKDEVCFVGDTVAVVIAESRYVAEDACALVDVDYEPLSAAVDCRAAREPGAATAHAGIADNFAAKIRLQYGDADGAFKRAAHVVRDSFWQHRGCGHPMETRGYVAEFHPASGELVSWSSGQNPHLEKKNLIDILEWDAERVRVIQPDVGGGFGPKAQFYVEQAVVAIAAMKLRRPVKWIEDRREHFMTATQERDQLWDVELATDDEGRILGMKVHMTHDNGAYLPWGVIMPYIAVTTTPGPYVVPSMSIELDVIFTNKVPTTPVRGAGRPQGVFAMERILDRAAQKLGLDRSELRRRNLIGPERMPYDVGFIYRDGKPVRYDSGDYPRCQAKALELADWGGFEARRARAQAEGRAIGIGIANYVEGTGLGPFEGGTVRVQQNGRVTVISGGGSHGQGHKTIFAQICADALALRLDQIDVITADTAAISMGIGTFASRITVNAGNSVHLAALNVRAKIVKLAGALLGAGEERIELREGRVFVRDEPARSMTFGALARISQGMPGFSFPEGVKCGLEDTQYFSPVQSTYCNGTHIAEVEVDLRTGQVKILKYSVAHDSGNLVNPLLVDGQIQGGVAHGIGNALFEWMGYDAHGQPVTTHFGEYLLPEAIDVPRVDMAHLETPSPLNPLGVKGAGEGGTIPAPASITAAIEDALREFGVRLSETPVPPQRLVEHLRASGAYRTSAPARPEPVRA